MSANNLVVVGGLDGGGGFYWMPTKGVLFNGGEVSNDVSGDGRTIVGIAKDTGGIRQAGIWIGSTEWRLLGSFTPTALPCETTLSTAYGVSRDGQVVVGFARDGCALGHAFRWTPARPGGRSRAPGAVRLVRLRRRRADRADAPGDVGSRPERCPAGSYQLFGVYLSASTRVTGSRSSSSTRSTAGTERGRTRDGPCLIFMADGDTPNTPIEVVETRYPIRCERHAYLPGVRGRRARTAAGSGSSATSACSSRGRTCSARSRTRSDMRSREGLTAAATGRHQCSLSGPTPNKEFGCRSERRSSARSGPATS